MSNNRPNVSVSYQDAPQQPMGCFEFVISIVLTMIFGIMVIGGLWWL